MKLAFRKSQIQSLADRYVADMSETEFAMEQNLISRMPIMRGRNFLFKYEVVEIVAWKLQGAVMFKDNQIKLINENENDITIKAKTEQALRTDDIEEAFKLLQHIKGVAEANASAILHFCHRDRFPIWDTRALQSLGTDEDNANWYRYVDFCRQLADERQVSMRTLDRALWKYPDIAKEQEAKNS